MQIQVEEIKKIAKTAGEEILKYYNEEYKIEYKTSDESSPLTEADLASNEIILSELEKYGYPILSEETKDDSKRLKSEYVWIVDPLDGTSDFVGKTDEFSVLIGLVQNGEPVLGVVYEPAKGVFYWAEKGEGAFMEKDGEVKKIQVSDKSNFEEMTILLSRNHLLEADKKLCEDLKIGKKKPRGSTSKMCVISRGDAEIYVNTSDKTGEWDTCASEMILTEAGGKITDISGESIKYNKEIPKNLNGFVASNGKKHDEIVNQLRVI